MPDVKKEIYLDFKGTIEVQKKQGKKISFASVAREMDYTSNGLTHLAENPPKSLVKILKYLKDNNFKIEDLVKERVVK